MATLGRFDCLPFEDAYLILACNYTMPISLLLLGKYIAIWVAITTEILIAHTIIFTSQLFAANAMLWTLSP